LGPGGARLAAPTWESNIAAPKTIEQAQRIAREIAKKFPVFECEECAIEIAKKLGKECIATFERLQTTDGGDIIGFVPESLLISKNGVHIGVKIGDLIYDNLHPDGVAAFLWPSRFVAGTRAPLERQSISISKFFGKIFLVEKFRRWVAGV
jgi:hypothetical protein